MMRQALPLHTMKLKIFQFRQKSQEMLKRLLRMEKNSLLLNIQKEVFCLSQNLLKNLISEKLFKNSKSYLEVNLIENAGLKL